MGHHFKFMIKPGNVIVTATSNVVAAYWICENNVERDKLVWVGLWPGAHVYGDEVTIQSMENIFREYPYIFKDLDTWFSIKDDRSKWDENNISGKSTYSGNVNKEGW